LEDAPVDLERVLAELGDGAVEIRLADIAPGADRIGDDVESGHAAEVVRPGRARKPPDAKACDLEADAQAPGDQSSIARRSTLSARPILLQWAFRKASAVRLPASLRSSKSHGSGASLLPGASAPIVS